MRYHDLTSLIPNLLSCELLSEAQTGWCRQGNLRTEQKWEEACSIVNSSSESRRYLNLVKENTRAQSLNADVDRWPGSFKPVRRFQEQVFTIYEKSNAYAKAVAAASAPTRTLRKRVTTIGRSLGQSLKDVFSPDAGKMTGTGTAGPSSQPAANLDLYPDAEDEAIVNTSLILLLEALADLVPGTMSEWVLNHVHFNAKFNNGSYNAYTDGVFWTSHSRIIQAIVEVKKRISFDDPAPFQMQETAEMVGWILKESNDVTVFNNK